MTHRATEGFWRCFEALPESVQRLARKNHRLLERDSRHPSLRLKTLAGHAPPLWSVRVGRGYRALAVERDGDLYWFWIGSHADYDRITG